MALFFLFYSRPCYIVCRRKNSEPPMLYHLLLIVALATVAVRASPTGPVRPRQSTNCSYTCPTTDMDGNVLVYPSHTGGGLGCLYDDHMGGYTCMYSYTNGKNIGGRDSCYPEADQTCSRRGRGWLSQ
ncbi:hypothetical protein CALVIDRAFT_411609 [Calocera viscosa TUFC12733]|uniref:Uncharacterized protein n=1 Tax=Calocera viscosa (strain TUFC12733) TaxID=1330018 RepID=A0A167G6A5_CALVF|nr:hypothetical protein CALVIDRAFT_411609 [Calocera viscosa TUFC12733]